MNPLRTYSVIAKSISLFDIFINFPWQTFKMQTPLNQIFTARLSGPSETRAFRLFNFLMIVGIVIVFAIGSYMLYAKEYVSFYVCLVEELLFISLFILHLKGYHIFPRYIFFIVSISAQVYGSLFHGENGGFDFFFIVTAVAPVFFFEEKWQYLSLFVISLAGIISVKYLYDFITPVAPFEEKYMAPYYIVICSTIFLIFALYAFFKSDHLKYEKKMNDQREEITAQKESLALLKDQLEELLKSRTLQVAQKDEDLRKYAFHNAHTVRSPLARILGLINLVDQEDLSNPDTKEFYMTALKENAHELDKIIKEMNKILYQGSKE